MFIAYYAADNLMEQFDSFSEAKKWLEELWAEDGTDEGFSDETLAGKDYISKVICTSKYMITDKKENYVENSDGVLLNKNGDEWTIGNNFDFIGNIVLVDLNGNEVDQGGLDARR